MKHLEFESDDVEIISWNPFVLYIEKKYHAHQPQLKCQITRLKFNQIRN